MMAMKILLGAVMALIVLGGAAMAGTTGSSVISATVNPGIEVSASDHSVAFDVGQNSINIPDAVTVDANKNPWTLKAQGGNSGYFLSSGTNHNLGYQLGGPLTLSVDLKPGEYTGGSGPMDSQATLAGGVAVGSFTIPVNFVQTVRGSEPAVSDYQITITYTASLA